MIALCDGTPSFEQKGDLTLVSFPSGEGDGVKVALTRNQLCQLLRASGLAVEAAFAMPEPEKAAVTKFRRGGKRC